MQWSELIESNKTEISAQHINEMRDILQEIVDDIQSIETDYSPGFLPIGAMIWYDSPTLPTYGNWSICNGTNGTKDLQEKFIIGAGNKYAIGTMGGEASVLLTLATSGRHMHLGNITHYNDQSYNDKDYPAANVRPEYNSDNTGTNWSDRWTGQSGTALEAIKPHNNIPPYYAMLLIKRIG